MRDLLIYLAHPWAYNPEESFIFAVKNTKKLRQLGYLVFSPILHTHHYWKELEDDPYLYQEDFVEWDLGIIENFRFSPNFAIAMSEFAFVSEKEARRLNSENKGVFIVCNKKTLFFRSYGCYKEYLYAQVHKIPVLSLEKLLKGELEEI